MNNYIEYVEANPSSPIEDQMSLAAYHEAGHFVIAELLGFKILDARIMAPAAYNSPGAQLGYVNAKWPNAQPVSLEETTDPEELRAQALLFIGGSVGVILIGEHGLDTVYADMSEPDMDGLHTCIQNLIPAASESEKRATVHNFAFEAFQLLQPHQDRIREVATELYDNAGQTPPNLFPKAAQ